jgi:hypothetical protein
MGQIFCCVQVDQSTVAIRETFGKFDDVLEPGCHCLPWICGTQIAGHLTLRVQQLDVRCETKTKVYCIYFSLFSLSLSPSSSSWEFTRNMPMYYYMRATEYHWVQRFNNFF